MPRRSRRVTLASLVPLCVAFLVMTGRAQEKAAPATQPAFDPTDAYEDRTLEGWTVRINKKFLADDPALVDEVVELMRVHLIQVKRAVPKPAVEKLKGVVIWVERDSKRFPGMCYHPSADWLRENGMNPDKVRGIEVGHARNFLSWWREQPWMVLHELAHAYHHQFLPDGFDNPDVKAVYGRAKRYGLYDCVQRINGRSERAYAMEDPMEFFAENSEALFGTNDFYPFVRSELRKHDPETWEMLRKAWGVEGK